MSSHFRPPAPATRGGRSAVALLAWLCCSCSILIDTEPLEDGCEHGEKDCDGRCVSTLDPEYGCGAASCQPCVLPNANSICDAEERCAIAACVGNFQDCDHRADNGCEVNLDTNVEHCGSCDAPECEVPGAVPACARGECAIKKCLPGYRDCNRLDGDGCETRDQSSDAGADAAAPSCDPWPD